MEEVELDMKISKWKELKEFFLDRLKSPIEHPEYIFYFVIVVVGAGGISIWASIFGESSLGIDKHKAIIQNISAFSVAIIATGSIELFFVTNKYIKTTLFIISFCFISISVISYLICFNKSNGIGYIISTITSLFALLVWWIANAENAHLTQDFFVNQSEKSKELKESLSRYDDE